MRSFRRVLSARLSRWWLVVGDHVGVAGVRHVRAGAGVAAGLVRDGDGGGVDAQGGLLPVDEVVTVADGLQGAMVHGNSRLGWGCDGSSRVVQVRHLQI